MSISSAGVETLEDMIKTVDRRAVTKSKPSVIIPKKRESPKDTLKEGGRSPKGISPASVALTPARSPREQKAGASRVGVAP